MNKKLFNYTIYLTLIDLAFNLIINLIQNNPFAVIFISMIIRFFFLLILFPLVGLIISKSFFKDVISDSSLVATSILIYMLIPIIIYLIKPPTESLWKIIVDLHTKFNLFAVIFLPYIFASIINLLFLKRFIAFTNINSNK